MTAWHVTFEVDVPDGRAIDDGGAIAYATLAVINGDGVITVEPTDPPSRFASLDPEDAPAVNVIPDPDDDSVFAIDEDGNLTRTDGTWIIDPDGRLILLFGEDTS